MKKMCSQHTCITNHLYVTSNLLVSIKNMLSIWLLLAQAKRAPLILRKCKHMGRGPPLPKIIKRCVASYIRTLQRLLYSLRVNLLSGTAPLFSNVTYVPSSITERGKFTENQQHQHIVVKSYSRRGWSHRNVALTVAVIHSQNLFSGDIDQIQEACCRRNKRFWSHQFHSNCPAESNKAIALEQWFANVFLKFCITAPS